MNIEEFDEKLQDLIREAFKGDLSFRQIISSLNWHMLGIHGRHCELAKEEFDKLKNEKGFAE